MSDDNDRSDFEDLCDEDGPPAFCPRCEERGHLSEVVYQGSDGHLCENCSYRWDDGADDDGPISDRERL